MKLLIEENEITLRTIENTDELFLIELKNDSFVRAMNGNEDNSDEVHNASKSVMEDYILVARNDSLTYVIQNVSGDFCGIITTHHCDKNSRSFKYGVSVREKFRRKGYALKAINAILKYYFHELCYLSAIAEVYSLNKASIELHEKLKFKKEKIDQNAINICGKLYDKITFVLTRNDFVQF